MTSTSHGDREFEMIIENLVWEDFRVDMMSQIGFLEELHEFPTHLSELPHDFTSPHCILD